MKAIFYQLNRFLLKVIARPTLTGGDNLTGGNNLSHKKLDRELVYVMHHRSVTDLIMLDLICQQHDFTSPLQPLGDLERQRMLPLLRAAGGRITMHSHSSRLLRLIDAPQTSKENILLVPVSVFWGRAMSGQNSIFSTLTSEHWAVTGRFKRLLNLLINRHNIVVHLGRPIGLAEVASADIERSIAIRRTARLLRVRLRQQKVTALGPDFSHRRTLLNQVVGSRGVKSVIEQSLTKRPTADTRRARKSSAKVQHKLERRALKYARTIASDMSHPTIRVLARALRWFWTRIYDGIDIRGVEHLEASSATHTLVYVPSHRSHLDYLLLSYMLYYEGFMIPHIAAGDNLNQPLLGGVLRRGGAFFMRRSFRGDPLYAAVFNEYLYQVYRRGHSVEFFPEGGRTRSGRLMPAKFGLLKTTVEHQMRGLPKPLAFVPVYFGYEKVVEGSSYLSELRGASKKGESLADVFRNIKLIRQNFGRVNVNLAPPIELDRWLQHNLQLAPRQGKAASGATVADSTIAALGSRIMQSINQQATVNPVNLVALVTLAMANSAIEEAPLRAQITCYQTLLTRLYKDSSIHVSPLAAEQVIHQVERLGLLSRYQESFGDVLGHEPFAAVLMTWYRNNVVHTMALASLIACLTVKQRRPMAVADLQRMVQMIYPYLALELCCHDGKDKFTDCIEIMTSLGLLYAGNGTVSPPRLDHQAHLQLNLLANLVSQTLERMFIVIHQLGQGNFTRESLQASSRLVAQKISRLYGINAPEFSDQGLFDQFINRMIANGVVFTQDNGTLSHDPALDEVLRAAEFIINPQIRYGVLSASAQQAAQVAVAPNKSPLK